MCQNHFPHRYFGAAGMAAHEMGYSGCHNKHPHAYFDRTKCALYSGKSASNKGTVLIGVYCDNQNIPHAICKTQAHSRAHIPTIIRVLEKPK